MIGIVIVTHESLGRAYAQLARHFFSAVPEHIRILGVEPDEDHDAVIRRTQQAVAESSAQAAHGVLVLADIFGATPCNAARRLVVPEKVAILTGLNAPMLVKAAQYSAAAEDLAAFTEAVREAAVGGIIAVTRPPEGENPC
ncbi:PTS sugar transporter subunit IIA [Neisseria sp. 23W00296]|uniref:PTS sugar transporter subunit IIA n=1 Tax=unclassified Neisseria TaxID=2623750 RepID=UPI0002A2FC36|nr:MULTISPECIES: PTS fructose IIA component [unclassified Neisseria]ASP18343.1 PTS mannose transporter subunit IIA [Neisseria sp. KEM232]EKY05319.1 PTS system fructose IIA component [Neisseria sp. oral taxon 020 str. F0370]